MVTKLNNDHSNADQVLAEYAALDEAYTSACGPAEAYNKDLLTLAATAKALVAHCEVNNITVRSAGKNYLGDLAKALEQFEPWLDGDSDDPRANGWVDDKGRP